MSARPRRTLRPFDRRLNIYLDEPLLKRIQVIGGLRNLTDSGAARALIEERLRQIEAGEDHAHHTRQMAEIS
jgi:hypothetical protein